jgi:hypothetical protein
MFNVVTIAREHGSSGSDIGRQVANLPISVDLEHTRSALAQLMIAAEDDALM